MEEPRTQDARPQDNRDVPRSRTPRAPFSAPEPAKPKDGPAPTDQPTERAPRRQGGAKAAPAVTFQQPQDKESKSSSGTGSEASVPGKSARVTQSRKGSAKANRAKPDAAKPSMADTARPQVPAARPAAPHKPADAEPEINPVDAKPVEAKPVDAKPADAKPADAKPVEAKPTAPKRVDAKPTPPKPVDVKPTPPKPVDVKATPPKPVDAKPTAPEPVNAMPTAPRPVNAMPTAPKPVDAKPTAPKPVGAQPTAPGDSGSQETDATSAPATPATAKAARKGAGRRTTTGRGAVPAEEVTPAVVKPAPAKRTPRKATAGAADASAAAPETAGPDTTPTEPTLAAAASVPAAVTEARPPATDTPAAVAPATSVAGKEKQAAAVEQTSGDVPTAAPVAVAATTVATAAASVARYDWSKVVSDPGHTPELLALAAVETIGPRAAEWVRRTRESYPTATPQGLARLAIAEFTRRGTVGAALGAVAGSYAPMALIGAAVWTQAELVLHVAAAHGHDPADQARAAELLVLAKVHPTREDAEAALAAARQPGAGSVDARLRVGRPLATQVGGWLAIRAVNRFFPGTSVVLATLFSRGAAEMLGVRAIGLYEGKGSR